MTVSHLDWDVACQTVKSLLEMRTSVLILAINYGTADKALEFAECLASHAGGNTGLTVAFIDNTDGEKRGWLEQELQVKYPLIACWTAPRNLGYFGGARFGLARATRAGLRPNWVAVTNVDVACDPTELQEVLANHDDSHIGVIAPAIRSSLTGRALNPFLERRPPRWRMHGYKYLFRRYWGLAGYTWLSRVTGGVRQSEDDQREGSILCSRAIYAPHGAFVVLSRELLTRAAPLDHPPFLFGEEFTVAEAARIARMPVLFEPRIRVIHREHASTSAMPSKVRHAYIRDAAAYCADAFFS